jgi:hypothetical protein
MELRPLGRTGVLVSVLGLGTVKLGRNQAVKYPRPFDLPTDAEALALLDSAAELGINLLDTAPAYGSAEERLGKLLAGRRDRWILSTKVGEEFERGRSRFDFSRRAHHRQRRPLARPPRDRPPRHRPCPLRRQRDFPSATRRGTPDRRRRRDRGRSVPIARRPRPLQAGGQGPRDRHVAQVHRRCPRRDAPQRCPHAHAQTRPSRRCSPSSARPALPGVGVLIKKGLRSGHLPTDTADPIEQCFRYLLAEPGVSSVVVGTVNPAHLRHNVGAADAAAR